MNKDTLFGFLLIGLVLIGFSWYNQPSQEEMEAYQRQQDSIAAAQKDIEVKKSMAETERKAKAEEAAKAEAEAAAIEKITTAVGQSTNPANYLLAQKYIQMMQELAAGDKTKTVYLPYEATNVLGSLAGIKELFKDQ